MSLWLDATHALVISPLRIVSWNTDTKAIEYELAIHENLPVSLNLNSGRGQVIVFDLSTNIGIYSASVFRCKSLDDLVRLGQRM